MIIRITQGAEFTTPEETRYIVSRISIVTDGDMGSPTSKAMTLVYYSEHTATQAVDSQCVPVEDFHAMIVKADAVQTV